MLLNKLVEDMVAEIQVELMNKLGLLEYLCAPPDLRRKIEQVVIKKLPDFP